MPIRRALLAGRLTVGSGALAVLFGGERARRVRRRLMLSLRKGLSNPDKSVGRAGNVAEPYDNLFG